MDQNAAPLHGARQAFRVAQIAFGQGEVQTVQIAAVAAGADQGAHGMTPREEGACDGGTDEPGRASEEGRGSHGRGYRQFRRLAGAADLDEQQPGTWFRRIEKRGSASKRYGA